MSLRRSSYVAPKSPKGGLKNATHSSINKLWLLRLTRLPSNLRPNTRECVRLVTRGHFQSRDKDGGHTIQSATSENPMLHANFITLMFYRTGVIVDEVLHCGNRDFRPFSLLWPRPWPDDLHIQTWPVFHGGRHTGCANINFLRQGFRKLSSDRQTRPKLYTTQLRGWSEI